MTQKPATSDHFETLLQAVEILKRRRAGIFMASLLTAALAIVIISLLPNRYRATTTILVDPQKIPERYVASTVTTDSNAHLNTLTQQVLSASRLQEIVDQLNLYPELRKSMSREELIDFMRKKIVIELKPGSDQSWSSFSISYIDADRNLVAPVANQLATSFIDWNLNNRQQQAQVTTQFLSSELVKAQEGLQQQEAALQAFRLQHSGATPDQLNANLQALSRLQVDVQANLDAISRLDEERILVSQQQPVDIHDPSPGGERARLTQERNRLDSELQSLRRQYTDTYPDVVAAQRQLQDVNTRLAALPPAPAVTTTHDPQTAVRLDLINKEIQRHKEQLDNLQRQIGAYQQKVQSVPVLETQLAELTRNYETSRQNYQSLLDKRLSAGMSEDLERRQQAERFTVLDSARTPGKPSQPKRLPLMAGAMLVSLVLPGAVAIAFGLHNGALRSETELMTMLPPKARIMATVPPILSERDLRHARLAIYKAAAFALLTCGALTVFLLKVRPIL